MIQIKWEILQQEGRSIKALADISNIRCKFIAKPEAREVNDKQNITSISSFQDIEKLARSNKELDKYFGTSQNERLEIRKLLTIYKSEIKTNMKMPVLFYYQNYPKPLPCQLLSKKYKQVQEGIEKIRSILKARKSDFVCGEQIRVIDILIYFDVCNLIYFGQNHNIYPQIKEWFSHMYKIRAIKTITHQWFSMARQIIRSMRVRRAKPKI